MKCPVCDSNSVPCLGEIYDDRYGYRGRFSHYRCTECGHVFLDAHFNAGQLSRLYSDYYQRAAFDLENYRPHIERSGFMSWLDGARASAFRWVPRNVRILDIGCGFCEALGYHQARGCDVYGVEADENARRVADRYGFRVHVGLFDADNYMPASFDYVTMDQVMEHVTNPVEVLRGLVRVLKPGGIAVLSVPNADGWGARVFGRRWLHWHAPYHMQFYSVRSIRVATEKAGLVMDRHCTVTPSAWLDYQWRHLLEYPVEGEPSIFWCRTNNHSPTQRIISRGLSLIHLAKVNHLVTRIFDLAGLGDNRLFFLRKP